MGDSWAHLTTLDTEFLDQNRPSLKDILPEDYELGAYLVAHSILHYKTNSKMATRDSKTFCDYARTIYRMELVKRNIPGYYPPRYPPDHETFRWKASQMPDDKFQALLADIIFEHTKRRLERIPWSRFRDEAPTLEAIAEGYHINSDTLVFCVERLMNLACKERFAWGNSGGGSYSSGLFLLYQLIISVTSEDPPNHQVGLFEHLIRLQGREACVVLNALQLILDFSVHINDASSRVAILKALHRLSSSSGMYPSVLSHSRVQPKDNPIAGGSFGQVCKAECGDKVLALKIARLDFPPKVFCKEVVTWCNLSHDNVLPFYGAFLSTEQGRLTLVSPFMEKGNVKEYLSSQYPRIPGPRFKLMAGIVSGLKYLHTKGVIHGDLKGVNILVSDDERACLADFGISTVTTTGHMHLRLAQPSTARPGTMAFQAPELLEHPGPIYSYNERGQGNYPSQSGSTSTTTRIPLSKESDIYALACVFYEIMTMESPFSGIADAQIPSVVLKGGRPGEPASTHLAYTNLGLTRELWALIRQCWHQRPNERPRAEDLLQQEPIFSSRIASSSFNDGEWDAAQMRQNNVLVGLGFRPLNEPFGSTSTMYTTDGT